jgi:AcrR family transcriptional regulator
MQAIPTRERILIATAELFRRQGYTGTGLKQVAAEAQAPFGSLYHHFPDGKDQLAAEVLRRSGAMYLQLFVAIALQAPDVPTGVGEFFTGAAQTLCDTGYTDACPIATVALEVASTNEPLRIASAEVFESWISGATKYFATAGISREQAHALALSMLCLLEGAFLFSRALRTTEPMLIAGESAVAAVRAALSEVSNSRD